MPQSSFPDVTDSRVKIITIIPWFTGDIANQKKIIDTIAQAWKARDSPLGLLSAHCFASVHGESILLYLQWESEQAIKNLDSAQNLHECHHGLQPFGSSNSTAYRLYRSLGGIPNNTTPTQLICAFFDTDGPERQRYIADALIKLAADLPDNPAALSSHFHLSLDGTRVINYTEWSDVESHDIQANEGAYDKIYHVSTSTPGVRSLKGNQYRHVAQWP